MMSCCPPPPPPPAPTSSCHHNHQLGFFLLPSELIHTILLNLALPDIQRLRSVSKSLSRIISDHSFLREFNSRSTSSSCLFFCKKRWPQDATVHGFTDCTHQWFTIPIARILKPAIYPREDIYFLTANNNIFLFASNTQRGLIAVDIVTKRVTRIPHGPFGPRGTSSWRRSAMKLLGTEGSTHFRFIFVESVQNHPTLFIYSSETDTWQFREAEENNITLNDDGDDYIFLNLINGPRENVVIAVGSTTLRPIILRPRFNGTGTNNPQRDQNPTVGFSWGNLVDRLHVYGDGHMMIVRSSNDIINGMDRGTRMLGSIELWRLSRGGDRWEMASEVPGVLMGKLKRPYGVLMGCLEARDGILRAALVSNFEGLWDIIWLNYDKLGNKWNYILVPDCRMKGSNMAGIAFSTGLTLPLSSTM